MPVDDADVWLAWGRKAGLKLLDAFSGPDPRGEFGSVELEQGGSIRIGGDRFVVDGLILRRETEEDASDP